MSWQFYRVSNPKAKKDYKCDLCRLRIPAGVNYYKMCGVYEREFVTTKSHFECSDEWKKQNTEAEDGDTWGWFEAIEDGCPKEWNDSIRKKYNLGEVVKC